MGHCMGVAFCSEQREKPLEDFEQRSNMLGLLSKREEALVKAGRSVSGPCNNLGMKYQWLEQK